MNGGGGGAGGYVECDLSFNFKDATNYSITIGAGGFTGRGANNLVAGNGTNSKIYNDNYNLDVLVAIGGGGGAHMVDQTIKKSQGATGGSGGGSFIFNDA